MRVPNRLKPLKSELYLWRKACGQGILHRYLYNRYLIAPGIRLRSAAISKPVTHPDLTVHMLLCHRDLTMALWSLASFYRVSSVVGRLMVHSDGTLTDLDKRLLRRLIPEVTIVERDEADEAVRSSQAIPEEVRRFRLETPYVYLKKLVDTFVVAPGGYHLLIDSDLAWFSAPTEFETVVAAGKRMSLMTLNGLHCSVWKNGGGEFPQSVARYNGGIIFFHHDDQDLTRLIEFIEQVDMDRPQRYVGQTGHAYCLDHLNELPWERYPNRGPITPETVMMHYTQPRRARFYADALPRIRELLGERENVDVLASKPEEGKKRRA